MLGVVNKVAIAVIVIIAVALGGGMLLDRALGTGGIFTVLLVVASVPVTLTAIFKISMATIAQIEAQSEAEESEDDAIE